MKPDVVVYISSVANAHKHPRKIACLESFAMGVRYVGHSVHVETENVYQPSKLAVILGWANDSTKGGPNIALRKQIISQQAQQNNHTMCIDASCFKYLDNNSLYLRYSTGGPYYDQANYANTNSDSTQWNRICHDLGVGLKPWKQNANGHILVCMQRDGGFAMKDINPLIWLDQKIKQIRQISQRCIVIRPHPGAYVPSHFAQYRNRPDILVVDPKLTRLVDNLVNAHSAVFFNSSASVAAACAGVPVFVDDKSCVSWGVANNDLSKLETPNYPDRSQWIYDLATAHWTDADSQKGLIYQKFLPHLI